jgi:hypothetical protein
MTCAKMEKAILKCFGEVNILGSDEIEIQQCLDPILRDRERKFEKGISSPVVNNPHHGRIVMK